MRYALSTEERPSLPAPGAAPRVRIGAKTARRYSAARRVSVKAFPAGRRNVQSSSRGSAPFAVQMLPPLGLFLTLVFQLWIRVSLIESSYALESIRQTAVNRDAEVRELRSDLAVITSPRTLGVRARQELKMILPPAKNIRKIEEK